MSDFAMSGDDLEQMYQEVILEASKNPHGKEHFAPDLASENASQAGKTTVQATHEYCTPGESHQFNPTCGDEATVHVEVSDQEPYVIERLVWDGHGCSISQASLSVMVDLVEGKTVDEPWNWPERSISSWNHAAKAWTMNPPRNRWKTASCSKECPSIQCVSSARCSDGKA